MGRPSESPNNKITGIAALCMQVKPPPAFPVILFPPTPSPSGKRKKLFLSRTRKPAMPPPRKTCQIPGSESSELPFVLLNGAGKEVMHEKRNKVSVFISTKPRQRNSSLIMALLPPAWEPSKGGIKAGHGLSSSAHAEEETHLRHIICQA